MHYMEIKRVDATERTGLRLSRCRRLHSPSLVGSTTFSCVSVCFSLSGVKPSSSDLTFGATLGRSFRVGLVGAAIVDWRV